MRHGDLIFTSGQLPFVDGGLRRTGKVGGSVDVEAAAADAKVCALNGLAAIDEVKADDLGVWAYHDDTTGFERDFLKPSTP